MQGRPRQRALSRHWAKEVFVWAPAKVNFGIISDKLAVFAQIHRPLLSVYIHLFGGASSGASCCIDGGNSHRRSDAEICHRLAGSLKRVIQVIE